MRVSALHNPDRAADLFIGPRIRGRLDVMRWRLSPIGALPGVASERVLRRTQPVSRPGGKRHLAQAGARWRGLKWPGGPSEFAPIRWRRPQERRRPDRLRAHYTVEHALAERLVRADKEERKRLYSRLRRTLPICARSPELSNQQNPSERSAIAAERGCPTWPIPDPRVHVSGDWRRRLSAHASGSAARCASLTR